MICRVVIPVNGVKRNRDGSVALKKRFKVNSKVNGNYVKHGLLPENSVILFMTKEGYLIPPHCLMEEQNINTESNFDDVKEVKESEYLNNDKINEIKNKGILDVKSVVKNSKLTSKYTIQGAIGGGLVMLIFAMYKGKSKLLFSTLGLVGGGFLGNLYKKHIA